MIATCPRRDVASTERAPFGYALSRMRNTLRELTAMKPTPPPGAWVLSCLENGRERPSYWRCMGLPCPLQRRARRPSSTTRVSGRKMTSRLKALSAWTMCRKLPSAFPVLRHPMCSHERRGGTGGAAAEAAGPAAARLGPSAAPAAEAPVAGVVTATRLVFLSGACSGGRPDCAASAAVGVGCSAARESAVGLCSVTVAAFLRTA